MSQVNEFALNLPISSVGGVAATPAPVAGYHPVDITSMTTIPADVNASECSHISVYVDSTQMVDYDPKSPQVLVDMVLCVCITDPSTGAGKNYKMVKRLAMDKCKLACDAEAMVNVQFVEDLEDDPVEVAKIMEQFYAAKRAREVAGLAESAGTLTFKVLATYDDPSGEGRASTTVTINKVKDKAHARHVFDVKHAQKYPNAKITRVTEVK